MERIDVHDKSTGHGSHWRHSKFTFKVNGGFSFENLVKLCYSMQGLNLPSYLWEISDYYAAVWIWYWSFRIWNCFERLGLRCRGNASGRSGKYVDFLAFFVLCLISFLCGYLILDNHVRSFWFEWNLQCGISLTVVLAAASAHCASSISIRRQGRPGDSSKCDTSGEILWFLKVVGEPDSCTR